MGVLALALGVLGAAVPPALGAVPAADGVWSTGGGGPVPGPLRQAQYAGALADGPDPGPPGAGRKSVGALLGELGTLYQRTEAATEAYNGTAEKLKKERASARRARAGLARARAALTTERTRAGELARQQYRRDGTGLPPAVQLLLTSKPDRILDHGHLLSRAVGDQAEVVKRVSEGERRHKKAAERARSAVERQERLAQRKKKQRDQVRERLRRVEELLSSLDGNQLARLHDLEADRTKAAQRKLVASGALDPSGATGQASPQGRKALDWALDQIGKPYVWGAEGPKAFDCSGLTSQAWRHAGRAIPRTSQEQWRRLPRIPLDELRPGDLVIYFPGATHVALYIGSGRVVQAPRPGGKVQTTPLATDPPIGAVRPDGRDA
ncbi:C40 family peptidase [Streptomyces albus]